MGSELNLVFIGLNDDHWLVKLDMVGVHKSGNKEILGEQMNLPVWFMPFFDLLDIHIGGLLVSIKNHRV